MSKFVKCNEVKRLKMTDSNIDDMTDSNIDDISHSQPPKEIINNPVSRLRDLCLKLNHPLPKYEITDISGIREETQFIAECSVASIKRQGIASTKKEAKEKSAQEIINIIIRLQLNENEKDVICLDDIMKETEEKDHKLIKIYRDYIEVNNRIQPGTLISERHNYFSNLDENIRFEAIKILDDESFLSDYDKFDQCLKKLQIQYKKSSIETFGQKNFVFVEVDSVGIDCCFANTEDKIWSHMVTYFREMLV